ncbi:MAG: hypothetical protein FJX66_05790 [Alphaproteobacteria bacterium]|nr:hypothetical protein [Alphaproteobacteria bacterium]
MSPTRRTINAGGETRRFSIREAVVVMTAEQEPPSWASGVVIGVTYGTMPLYDVMLDHDGTILRHVPAKRIFRRSELS